MTPLSGPSQRNCEWFVTDRQNPPMSSVRSLSRRPTTRVDNASMAAQHNSLPLPMVKVMPWPSCGPSVWSTTYAAE